MATDPSSLSTEALLAQSGWLNALARQLVGNGGAADDLVQDTLVTALRRPPEADRPLRPWLAKVARNLVRERARSEASRTRREASREPQSEMPSAAELSERLESQHLLVAAIRELAEPYRSTILLHYWEHLSSEEIARRLGIPSGTVRWRLKQGVDALRQRLDARSGGDRRAWIALLAPLTRESSPAAVATSASIASGVLGMNLVMKLCAGITLLVALGTGWWVAVAPPPTGITVPAQHESVSFEPLAESAPGIALVESSAASREPIADPLIPAESETKPADSMSVTAHVVDEQFRPIAGATLRIVCGDVTREATSDDRGEATLGLDARGSTMYVFVSVRAPGRVSHSRFETVSGPGAVHLGDIVLAPGGAVSGTIRARDRAPLAGARVSLDALDLPQAELERRFVPFFDPHNEPWTRAGADGTFLLEGVPAGFVRLLASDESHLPGFSGVIEVRAGYESRGVELALDPIPTDRVLRGIVRDPDGVALSGAHVEYRAPSSSGTFRTDAEGRFATLCSPGDSFDLFVEDKQRRWTSVWLRDVRPSAGEVVLQFAITPECKVVVTDPSDRPLTEYALHVWNAGHTRKLQSIEGVEHPEGRATFHVPSIEFVLLVDSPTHQLGSIGPLTPSAVPAQLSIRLESAPEVRGHVRDSDGPVAGARVRLFLDQRQKTTYSGFPVFVEPQSIAEATSDFDGSFSLTARNDGPFYVRAETSSHAPSLVGPLDAGRAVDVLLTGGGAIEGRVLAAPGESAAGVIVGFSRGDACAFTRRVGPEGVFHVDSLTPGRWMVKRVEKEIYEDGNVATWRAGRWDEIPSNCEVLDGRTTYFDVDLGGGDGKATLVGQLSIDGHTPGAWSGRLVSTRGREQWTPDTKFVVDASGRFRASVAAEDDCRLFLTCLSGELDGLRLGANVTVRGSTTHWSLDLATARLDVDGRSSELPPKEHFAYSVSGIPQLFLALRPLPEGDDRVTIAVPAGKAEIVRFHDETGAHGDPVSKFDLRPGQSARCRRP